MFRTISLAGLGLLALFSVPVAAADRSLPRAQEWPVYTAPRAYNWTGVYAGIHAGGAFDRFTGTTAKKSRNELLLGGQIGSNLQLGNMVFGWEGDMSMNGMGKGTKHGGVGADMRYLGTLKARAGVAFDRLLVYGTGGLAYGSLKATDGLVSKTKSKLGYVVGAGAEYGITDHLSAKLEYNYVSLGKQNFQLGNTRSRVGVTEHLVKAGLNYRF